MSIADYSRQISEINQEQDFIVGILNENGVASTYDIMKE
jgi:hypothetical protein